MKLLWVIFVAFLCWMGMAGSVEAGTVSKVQGKSVLIELDGDSLQVGDEVFSVDGQGKRKSLIQITKVQGGKALGTITKGAAAPGHQTQARTAGAAGGGPAPTTSFYVGGLASVGFNNMQITVTNAGTSNTFSTTGLDYGIKGLAEFYLGSSISLRGLFGYESLTSEGKASGNFCTGSQNCSTTISYFTTEFLGKYNFGPRTKTSYWGGGGLGFLIPLSKSSTSIRQDTITTSTALIIGGGMDLALSGGWRLPLQLTYSYFIPPGDVSVSIISLAGGIMLPF